MSTIPEIYGTSAVYIENFSFTVNGKEIFVIPIQVEEVIQNAMVFAILEEMSKNTWIFYSQKGLAE